MTILKHKNELVTEGPFKGMYVVEALYDWALQNPEEPILVIKSDVDADVFIESVGKNPSKRAFISNFNSFNSGIGYIEDSPFINSSNTVKYPTWIKGTNAFYIHSSVVKEVSAQISASRNLLYWVNSIGKLTQPKGVFCYQLPVLHQDEQLSDFDLYRFVKQHYKRRWTFFLLFCHLIYEKKFPFFAFVKAQFFTKRSVHIEQAILTDPVLQKEEKLDYDVIIPTLGRPHYLYDVLKDFCKQTILPSSVIIVEQNAESSATSQLHYLKDEFWPFEIIHEFIYQTGACNARNIALSLTKADWILLFDDDNRFPEDLMYQVANALRVTCGKALNLAYLQKEDIENQKGYFQWAYFGSGSSIVHRDILNQCKFDLALEHGYGEDADYGMQIRNEGYDIIYAPEIQVRHLKAPTGGFRSKFRFPWHDDPVQPKPSPQVMYFRLKCYSNQQLLGYKIVLAIKMFRRSKFINPWRFYRKFKKQWESSKYYAKQLADY